MKGHYKKVVQSLVKDILISLLLLNVFTYFFITELSVRVIASTYSPVVHYKLDENIPILKTLISRQVAEE